VLIVRYSRGMSVGNPQRLLICGDLHGDERAFLHALDAARFARCEAILQLGDFGIWAHTRVGRRFLERASAELEEAGIPLVFVDGNHENFDTLHRWKMYAAKAGPFINPCPGIFYAPRGCSWVWSGVRLLACGGAASVDRDQRLLEEGRDAPRSLWWPEEVITEDDIRRCAEAGHVDICVFHDTLSCALPPGMQALDDPFIHGNQAAVERIALAAQPRLILHGHYHRAHRTTIDLAYGPVEVRGYDCNLAPGSMWGILDLADWRR